MVGRDKECAVLRRALRDDTAPTVVVAGPAGIGKTRLITEAVADRRDVRWVHPSFAAAAVPLGAFAEHVDPVIVDPLLRIRSLIQSFTSGADDPVVVVDDIQVLDQMSTIVVQTLMAIPTVRVVLGYRTAGPPTPLLAEVLGASGVLRIDLEPLSRTAVDGLVSQALGEDVTESVRGDLWRLTQGNSLYVTELLADLESLGAASLWDSERQVPGTVRVPKSLIDVVSTRIGDLPEATADVLDMVALAEPVPVSVITALTAPTALESAEVLRLVVVDDGPGGDVRLAHPLYGEVRRASAPATRLRRLRTLLVRELDRQRIPGMQVAGNKGVLALAAEPFDGRERILLEGAVAAAGLVALPLAAELAAQIGPGEHYVDAQLLLAHIASLMADPESVEHSLIRARNNELDDAQRAELLLQESYHRLWACNDPAASVAVIDAARAEGHMSASLIAAQMMVDAARSRPRAVIDGAEVLARTSPVSDTARITADWAEVVALADVGLMRRAHEIAGRAHALADHSPWGTYWRMTLCDVHIRACELGNQGPAAVRIATAIRETIPTSTGDVEGWILGFLGVAQFSVGDLTGADDLLTRSLTAFDSVQSPPEMWFPFCLNAAEVAANMGDAERVRGLLARLTSHPSDGYGFRTARIHIVEASLHALGGATSVAAEIARTSAESAHAAGQLTPEVICLQYAVRFGDTTCADRLAVLAAELPEVPRARTTLAHARALAAGDGEQLMAAARSYAADGDLPAAVDAAAQAVEAFRRQHRGGAALTAREYAAGLATRSGADTPALRAAQSEDGLSGRQREIVRLAEQGLSNKEIADLLVLSVRTVEGHIYRSSQILGAPIRRTQHPDHNG